MCICKDAMYMAWVREEAREINSDGCSVVPDFFLDCCRIHDLAYYYAKDPRSAYEIGDWGLADPIDQKGADALLKCCIQSKSRLGKWSPMAWWRYWALREFGAKAWHSHDATHQI
jgi:hypothetical protein